jgi:1-acyl-sn-glycerol-3-phosphate acyltransferase
MQDIVIIRPYKFVSPIQNRLWHPFLCWWVPRTVRTTWGVEYPTIRGLEHLQASIAAGDGILLAPNHCRPCDPLVVGIVHAKLRHGVYLMASWHLFMQGRVQRFMLRRAGAFSVYREGIDRESIKTAVDVLATTNRPLVVFAEGMVSRSNDRLGELMEGTAFIARSAAKQKAKSAKSGRVVVHPIALRYTFPGDLRAAVEPVLTKIEERISWRPQRKLPLVDRVRKLGMALLAVKEVEYMGGAQHGPLAERLPRLIDAVLQPLEAIYLGGKTDLVTIERVKKLRSAIVPAMIPGDLPKSEMDRRWRHLADCYFGQQLACYPIGYLDGEPTVERILETVERYEEDLTDTATIHRPMNCTIDIGPAIEVSADRPRGGDPLMTEIRAQLETMLAASASLCRPWKETHVTLPAERELSQG